ncbi:MAG: SDR family oxidoreductase [Alphaproteobacteria bacterium]
MWFAAVDALGGLEILVNSAARSLLRPAEEVTWDEWNTLMDVNLRGPYFLCGHMARHCMAESKPGAIVCLSSTHGSAGLALRSVYGVSKGGINQMMRALAIEWVEHGIRVNAVSPTTVMTEARKAFLPEGPVRDRALSRIPTGRFPEPSEINAAVRYLISDDAASVTGHVLNVDGGLLAE